MRSSSRRRVALVAAALLGTAGLAVTTPSPGSAAPGPTLLRVSGTLLSAAPEDGGEASYAVALANGDLVPVTGDLADAPARARFTGTLRVPGAIATSLTRAGAAIRAGSTLMADTADGRAALALVDQRALTLAVESADTEAPATQTGPVVHHVYLAAPDNIGALALTDAQIIAKAREVGSYWEGESEGRISDTVLPATVRHYATAVADASNKCGFHADATFWNVVQEAAALFPSVDLAEGTDQLGVVLPETTCGGGALGVASSGASFATGGGFVVLDNPGQFVGVTAHETGHNFGFGHANLQTCSDESLCTTEYGGIFDVMGYGIGEYDQTTALSTPFREFQGIVQPGEVERLGFDFGSASQTITRTIGPRSNGAGLRSLLLTDPDNGKDFYLDYRSGAGTDAGSAYAAGYGLYTIDDGVIAFRSGVVRERADGDRAVLLVQGKDASMLVGETWTNDSGSLSISVSQADASGATVTVAWQPGSEFPSVGGLELTTSDTRPGGYAMVDLDSTWDPRPWTTTQWLRDGVPISGETYNTYSIGIADVGHQLAARVSAYGYGLRPVILTTPSAIVGPAQFDILSTPTLTGHPSVGSTMTAVGGTWGPTYENAATTHWQWQADSVAIAGAPDSRFLTVAEGQAGKKVRACQVLSAPGYETTTVCSTESTPVTSLPAIPLIGTPTVSGIPGVDMALTGGRGTWSAGVTFTYAWLVDGQAVPGATGTAFAPRQQDVDKTVTFQVTGTKPGSATATRTSVPTGPVLAAITPAPLPTVTGTPKVGLPMTCVPGDWPAGTTFYYEWFIGGIPLGDGGASTYTPPGAYAGETISCRVTGTLDGHADTRRRSPETAPVARGTLTGAVPRIGGTVRVGRTLTAKPGTWTAGTRFAYRWYANGTAIPRATTSRLSLIRTLKGKRITVKVTGTRTGYTTLSRTSARTGRVAG